MGDDLIVDLSSYSYVNLQGDDDGILKGKDAEDGDDVLPLNLRGGMKLTFFEFKKQTSLTCLYVAWSSNFLDNFEMVCFLVLPQCGMCTLCSFPIAVSEVCATVFKVMLVVVNNYVNF